MRNSGSSSARHMFHVFGDGPGNNLDTRRRKVFTTRCDPEALRAPNVVNRNVTADPPSAL
ncbi:MAG: hypothetical protein M0Z63_12535 [Actinomycetota bacterium]|nr:hypothetical protein [Actinomycetota bacterium]